MPKNYLLCPVPAPYKFQFMQFSSILFLLVQPSFAKNALRPLRPPHLRSAPNNHAHTGDVLRTSRSRAIPLCTELYTTTRSTEILPGERPTSDESETFHVNNDFTKQRVTVAIPWWHFPHHPVLERTSGRALF